MIDVYKRQDIPGMLTTGELIVDMIELISFSILSISLFKHFIICRFAEIKESL